MSYATVSPDKASNSVPSHGNGQTPLPHTFATAPPGAQSFAHDVMPAGLREALPDQATCVRVDHPLGRAMMVRVLALALAQQPALRWILDGEEPFDDQLADDHDLALLLDQRSVRPPGCTPVGRLPLVLVGNPRLMQARGALGASGWLAGCRVMDLDFGLRSDFWRVRGLGRARGIEVPADTLHSRDFHVALRHALDGHGLAWLPPSLIEEELRSGQLVRALADGLKRHSPCAHVALNRTRRCTSASVGLVRLLGNRFVGSDCDKPIHTS